MYINILLRRMTRACAASLFAAAFLFGISAPLSAAEDCSNRGDLDSRFCDADGDLVADTPTDASKWLNPDTLIFSYTPVEDPSVYENVFTEFMAYLSKATGKKTKWYGAESYAAQVEAMRSGRLHVAGISTGPTVFGVNLAGYVPIAIMGKDDGRFGYKLQLITHKDTDIMKVSDLKGRNVAHVTPSSNSGNQAPRALFKSLGVEPDKDYEVKYSGKHDNLVIAASGDFDAAHLAEEIRAAFADAHAGGAKRNRPVEPEQTDLRSAVVQRPFEGVRVDLAWRSARFADPDAPILDLLSFILGECESSRLVTSVKDREQLVDRIDSSSYSPLDPGLLSVNFESDARRARQAIQSIVREVERLRAERVSLDELERARANFLANEHFERESVAGIASRLANFHVLGGDHRGDQRYLEAVRKATPEQLIRVARTHLDPRRLTVASVVPEDEDDTLDEASIRASVSSGVEATRRRFRAPTRSRRHEHQIVHSYELPHGGAVHVVPRRDVPVVAARAAFLGGLLAESDETAGISSFLSSIWTRGTRDRSASDFARAVESLAGEINGFSGRSSLGFTLEATSDKLEPVLDLFAEALLEPGFDSEEVERERRETLAVIERRADRLAQLAYLQLSETLYPTHPYRLPMLGSAESVGRIDVAALRAHHERLIRPENLVFAVAGDVDPDAIAESIAVRTTDLEARGFERPAPAFDEPIQEVREVRLGKERSQVHLVLGFPGLTVGDPDRIVLDVLSQVLAGQGGRLFLELRDKRGLAYSVSSINVEGVAPGFVSIYIATAPEKYEEAQRGILAELERLAARPPR